MKLNGLHLLLTYECPYECDHCFVWSSPRQPGTMTVEGVEQILGQAAELGTIEWIYFEGGEPLLYSALLRRGVRSAAARGFRVGIVSNAYWANGPDDALEALRDFAGLVQDLSISCDAYHGGDEQERHAAWVRHAAAVLGIPCGVIRIAAPGESAAASSGQLPTGSSAVMFRGRAAERLAGAVPQHHWSQFTACPHEDLREPGRVHVDPLGYVHLCQGISLGNVFERPLKEICALYRPDDHPIAAMLLAGGPALLARRYDVAHREVYADACHMCDDVRRMLRPRFPEILTPDQMYGPVASG
jgi:MoaA/NifB/PqqE/SkfB family radical SAM enzyme